MKRFAHRIAAPAVVAAMVLSFAAPGAPAQVGSETHYREGDRSLTALNILPPGQGRYMNSAELLRAQTEGSQPPHNTDQLAMYDAMVQAAPGVAPDQLDDLFKDASFGVRPDDVEREYSPRDGVRILRDASFGVPHVYGEKREDVLFGAGYVSAEDRLFMMDVLRHLGRGRLSEFLGASEANLAQDRAQRAVADYSEADLEAMAERARSLHPVLGPQFEADALAYADGVNAYIQEALTDPTKLPGEYPALQVLPEPWSITDSVAAASVIGAQLGVGGGAELRNAALLDALREAGLGPKQARAIFDDFRFEEDPEAPVTVDAPFPWLSDLPDADPDAVALPDDPQAALEGASPAPGVIDGPFGPIRLALPDASSNALLVGADLSKNGRPHAVFGPQTGYWSPQILMEIDMHGPGIHGRGAAFPGLSLYVLLGRGRDYAWSATSAGADQVDIFAVPLCEPGGGDPTVESTHYLLDGECREMQDTSISYVAKPSAGGQPEPAAENILVEIPSLRAETHSGPGVVAARATVDGVPVAFVRVRSSYLAEVDSGLTYVEMMDPGAIDGARDFQRAFGRFNFTFNWFYVDDRDIAYMLGGDHPIRPAGVDPSLPIWDGPENAWQGMLSFADTPKAISPSSGFITSWNNKQAPGFAAADNEWSYGPVHRSQPLDDRILGAAEGDGKVSLVELVGAMGDAATVDLRGDKVLPLMLDALGSQADPRLDRAIDLLSDWHASGAHRRDRDGDGEYEHQAAVALMDAWWDGALDAIFGPTLGGALDDVPAGRDDEPGPVGSAYIAGWYGQVHKDLRSVLGRPVQGRFSREYCGFGDPAACSEALRVSLDAAIAELESAHDVDPATWDVDEDAEKIRFTPLGVQGQDPMQWQNRPTFQQVMQFGDLCPGREGAPGIHHVGTSGADVLRGTPYDDVLCGASGADVLRGAGGDDLLLGGKGPDRLFGGSGRDDLRGGAGNDLCAGGPGADTLRSCERTRR